MDPSQRIRFTWDNPQHCPGTVVEVTFTPAAGGETAILLRHSRLPSPEHVAEMRTGCSWALDSLKSYLETGQPVPFEQWQAG